MGDAPGNTRANRRSHGKRPAVGAGESPAWPEMVASLMFAGLGYLFTPEPLRPAYVRAAVRALLTPVRPDEASKALDLSKKYPHAIEVE